MATPPTSTPPGNGNGNGNGKGPRNWQIIAGFVVLFAGLAFTTISGLSEVLFGQRVDFGYQSSALLLASLVFFLGIKLSDIGGPRGGA